MSRVVSTPCGRALLAAAHGGWSMHSVAAPIPRLTPLLGPDEPITTGSAGGSAVCPVWLHSCQTRLPHFPKCFSIARGALAVQQPGVGLGATRHTPDQALLPWCTVVTTVQTL
jgi:hypothetical protein